MKCGFKIARICPSHESEWRRLHSLYGVQSDTPVTEEIQTRLWSWICDSDRQTQCLVVVQSDQSLVGFAHYRIYERAHSASHGLYIEDLFVEERVRGSGIVDCLINGVVEEARQRGCDLVSWMTSDTNYRARAAYDRHAEACDWVTYEMHL